MKNIEYYQKEIREKYDYKLRYSANNVWKADLADALYEVWDEHTDGNAEVMEWLYEEHKEPILDDMEKAYLRDVIEPFRDRVNYVKAMEYSDMKEINIVYDKHYVIALPCFKKGTMYKGMKVYKEYTLKELEL